MRKIVVTISCLSFILFLPFSFISWEILVINGIKIPLNSIILLGNIHLPRNMGSI